MPTLPRDRLASSYLYYDAQADDARLTLTLARTAAIDHGAAVANGARLVEVHKDRRPAPSRGATIEADGERFDVRCSSIVNAGGVWADDVRALDEGVHPDSIRPAKGIHITVPWELVRNDIAVVVPVPSDKRSVFVVPWGDLHLHRHHRHRLRRPARRPGVHHRGHRVPAAGDQLLHHGHDHHERRHGHVGRPPPAREAGVERPHRRPVPPARGGDVGGRGGHRHRRQAHDLPRDGRRHGRRGRRLPRRRRGLDRRPAAPSASGSAAPRATTRSRSAATSGPCTWPTATAATPAWCWP